MEKERSEVAREGRISLGTPIMRLIPEPEKELSIDGSGLKIRTFEILLDCRSLITSVGCGRLLASWP